MAQAGWYEPNLRRPISRTFSRTSSQEFLTAPPVTYVCREAEVEPAEPTCGVGRVDGHLGDAQLGAGDLRVDGDAALADLRHGGVDGGDGLAADDLHAHPGGRVVVEALGEADVLDADRVADAPDDALAVGGVGQAAGQLPYVRVLAGREPLLLRRQRASP